MGQTLSRPDMDKKTESGGNEKYFYGVSEMQGWRVSMEDAHTTKLDLDEGSDNPNTFFAIFDGHGGAATAQYAGKKVHELLANDEKYQNKEYHAALKNAFLTADEKMRGEDPDFKQDGSGCTAVAALITNDDKLYVANAGDSRSVLSVKGKAKPLSFDHKPQNETEKSRIVAAGGYVSFGRVNGNLALARALGDFDYKKNPDLSPEAQIITANPEITEHQITEEDEFIILACDGIWDCLTSQQVIDCVRLLVSQGKQLPDICEEMCELCLAPDVNTGAGIGADNMTILIVALLHGRTVEQWYEWIADRVHQGYGYQTPSELPSIYPESRIAAFRARRAIWEERDRDLDRSKTRENSEQGEADPSRRPQYNAFGRILQDALNPHSSAGSPNQRMYNVKLIDDDEDDDDDETETLHGDAESRGDMASWGTSDATDSLRAQLDELERGEEDDDMHMESSTSPPHELQGEAPPPPQATSEDGINEKPKQLDSSPGGDAASSPVKAEGLMDTSESPLKV